jgi:uncharacterized Fe-S cluster-containing radical SAM superfamily enzyme
MNRRQPVGDDVLERLEHRLRLLLLEVVEARQAQPAVPATPAPAPAEAQVGDVVEFRIVGVGRVQGTVIGFTPHRIRIRRTDTGSIVLRAASNVRIIDHGGRQHATATQRASR